MSKYSTSFNRRLNDRFSLSTVVGVEGEALLGEGSLPLRAWPKSLSIARSITCVSIYHCELRNLATVAICPEPATSGQVQVAELGSALIVQLMG